MEGYVGVEYEKCHFPTAMTSSCLAWFLVSEYLYREAWGSYDTYRTIQAIACLSRAINDGMRVIAEGAKRRVSERYLVLENDKVQQMLKYYFDDLGFEKIDYFSICSICSKNSFGAVPYFGPDVLGKPFPLNAGATWLNWTETSIFPPAFQFNTEWARSVHMAYYQFTLELPEETRGMSPCMQLCLEALKDEVGAPISSNKFVVPRMRFTQDTKELVDEIIRVGGKIQFHVDWFKKSLVTGDKTFMGPFEKVGMDVWCRRFSKVVTRKFKNSPPRITANLIHGENFLNDDFEKASIFIDYFCGKKRCIEKIAAYIKPYYVLYGKVAPATMKVLTDDEWGELKEVYDICYNVGNYFRHKLRVSMQKAAEVTFKNYLHSVMCCLNLTKLGLELFILNSQDKRKKIIRDIDRIPQPKEGYFAQTLAQPMRVMSQQMNDGNVIYSFSIPDSHIAY